MRAAGTVEAETPKARREGTAGTLMGWIVASLLAVAAWWLIYRQLEPPGRAISSQA